MFINPQRACTAKVTVLGLSVCVLVPKLASRMLILAKIDTAYLTGDADQMICGNFAISAYGIFCIETGCSIPGKLVWCSHTLLQNERVWLHQTWQTIACNKSNMRNPF